MSRRPPAIWLVLLSVIFGYGALSVLIVQLLNLPNTFPVPIALSRLLGSALIVVGISLLVWALHHLSLRRAFGQEIYAPQTESALVTSGPYVYVRNPLYLGAAIALIGWTLLLQSTILIVATLFMLGHFVLVARWEAQELSARLGPDYEAYRRATPAFIPRTLGRGQRR